MSKKELIKKIEIWLDVYEYNKKIEVVGGKRCGSVQEDNANSLLGMVLKQLKAN